MEKLKNRGGKRNGEKRSVSRVLSALFRGGSHLSTRPTRRYWKRTTSFPQRNIFCLVLHRIGFTSRSCYHGPRWALTPPFHVSPRPQQAGQSGIFSAALSISERVGIHAFAWYPALWCPDFPHHRYRRCDCPISFPWSFMYFTV